MSIYVWDDGTWCYDFDWNSVAGFQSLEGSVTINLDYLYAYKDLTPVQIKACEEALSE